MGRPTSPGTDSVVDVSGYETLVLLHILGACVWIGAGVLAAGLGIQAARTGDGAQIVAYARQGRIVGVVVGVASLLLIVFGVWATLDADIDFGATWISIGLTAWLVAFVIAALFYGPYARRIRAAIEADGPGSPAVARLLRIRLGVSALEIVVLLVGLWAMVAKPA